MHAAENRFGWCSSGHQYVTRKDEMDKVIAFERGDCLFVFNFHHSNSYTDFGIGCCWNEPMRVVVDTDEGWFGGHHRLDWGHANGHPPMQAQDNRNHSIKLYVPARTGQILVRESLLKGGVKIKLTNAFLSEYNVEPQDLTIIMEDGNFQVPGADGIIHLKESFNATFTIKSKKDSAKIPCMASLDGMYRIYFPGKYLIDGLGVVEALRADDFPEEKPIKSASPAKQQISMVSGEKVDPPMMSQSRVTKVIDPDAKWSPKPVNKSGGYGGSAIHWVTKK
jgi:hypothetical protein